MTYQGRLVERDGTSLTGEHTMKFRLYDAESSGTKLWEEEHHVTMAPQDNGIFSLILGSLTPFEAMNFNRPLWLTIEVDGEGEMTPRQRLTSVGYAINADTLDGEDGSQFLRADVDTVAKGQLKLTSSKVGLLIQPATDPIADTKLLDVRNAAEASKFSVDLEGDVSVAGDLAVTGLISGSTATTGTTSSSWTIGSGADSAANAVSLLFGQSTGQRSIRFKGDSTADFAFSDPIRLSQQIPLRFEGATAGGAYVALKAPSAPTTYTLTLPAAVGSAGQVLTTDASGALSWATDANSGGTITGVTAGTGLTGGGSSGTVTLSLSTPVALANGGTGGAPNADDQILISSSTSAAWSSLPNCTDANGQHLNYSAATNTVSCGTGSSTSSLAFSALITGTNTTATMTLDSGSSLTYSGTGTVNANQFKGNNLVALADGGTGASTAAGARTALGAAASGANADITALSGLTTALSVGQGGTGAASFTTGAFLTGQGTNAVSATSVGPGLEVTSNQLNVKCLPIGGASDSSHSGTFQMGAFGGSDNNDRLDQVWPVPVSATITSLSAFVKAAPGSGKSWTVTLRKNAADTSLACTISGTANSCSANGSISFSAGDRLGVEFDENGSASGTQGSGWSACFVPT